MRFGADRLVAEPRLSQVAGPVALVTNDAARTAADSSLRTRAALLSAGLPISKIFSPEHGLALRAADGASVSSSVDALTGLPVVSLYGDKFAPAPEDLQGLEAVLFDIPDVGARFYTYAWTLTHVIDACAEAGIPVIVLDRPNPLGGLLESVEGPLLDLRYASFIGRHSIPIRHSLTLGELALLWRNERVAHADVRVIACEGWSRDMLWQDTGLPFVATSPAIQSFESALFYPGVCLFEATNLSVARGTPYSFQAVGAPWLDHAAVAERFAERGLAGVDVECIEFTPTTGPHEGERCQGVRLIARAAAAVRPVAIGLALLSDVIRTAGNDFGWARYATAANPLGEDHFVRLAGTREIRFDEPLGAAELAFCTAAPGWSPRWQSVVTK